MTLVKYENFCIFFPKKHALAECAAGIPAENTRFMACAGTNKAQCALLHKKTRNTGGAGACKVKKREGSVHAVHEKVDMRVLIPAEKRKSGAVRALMGHSMHCCTGETRGIQACRSVQGKNRGEA